MMAREIKRLEEQLKRALEGEAWHGPSVLELLVGVSADDAAAYPISSAHSIWEIVLHLKTDYEIVLRRLSGDGRQLTLEEAWPPCPSVTEENWSNDETIGRGVETSEAASPCRRSSLTFGGHQGTFRLIGRKDR